MLCSFCFRQLLILDYNDLVKKGKNIFRHYLIGDKIIENRAPKISHEV